MALQRRRGAGLHIWLVTWPRGEVVSELALAAVDYVRDLNRSLAIAPLAGLIRHDDLDLLAEKAAANPSRPDPREA